MYKVRWGRERLLGSWMSSVPGLNCSRNRKEGRLLGVGGHHPEGNDRMSYCLDIKAKNILRL